MHHNYRLACILWGAWKEWQPVKPHSYNLILLCSWRKITSLIQHDSSTGMDEISSIVRRQRRINHEQNYFIYQSLLLHFLWAT